MALAGGDGLVNGLLLMWTIVPVIAVVVGAYYFLRAGRRWEERERSKRGS